MKLKLDENLGRRVADLFRAAGHDAVTVRGQGLAGHPDRRIFDECQREGRCLLTLDLDFANPLLFNPGGTPGIAVIRLPGKRNHEDLLDASRTLIAGMEREDITGKLWIIQPGRLREYRPESEEDE
jgi:predicted nuclease of predicted toxin-antitoxin system